MNPSPDPPDRDTPACAPRTPPDLRASEEIVASGPSARRPERSDETYQVDRRGASTAQHCNRDAQQIYSQALSRIRTIALSPEPMPSDYRQAMQFARQIATDTLGEHMLISWYDRDRDFESPQHSSECHQAGAVPGYVDYGIHHGARLKVDIGAGRYVFFFMPLEPA